MYFKQERFFFNPKHLDKNYVYTFEQDFEELAGSLAASLNHWLNSPDFIRIQNQLRMQLNFSKNNYFILMEKVKKIIRIQLKINIATSVFLLVEQDVIV